MPRVSVDQEIFLDNYRSWLETVSEEVDDIGGWRNADANDRGFHYQFREPPSLFGQGQYLVAWVTVHHPKLDPTPIQELTAHIIRWHRSQSARGIPSQAKLLELLDVAVTWLNAADMAIIRQPDHPGSKRIPKAIRSTEPVRPKRAKTKSVRNELLVLAALEKGHNLYQDTPAKLDPLSLEEIVVLCGGRLSRTQVSRALKERFGSHRKYVQKMRAASDVEVVEGMFNKLSDGSSAIDGVAG